MSSPLRYQRDEAPYVPLSAHLGALSYSKDTPQVFWSEAVFVTLDDHLVK